MEGTKPISGARRSRRTHKRGGQIDSTRCAGGDICHSHDGSAVAYGAKAHPDAFRSVRTIVCLATPFFGVSVRPGYQALLLASLVSLFFFQLLFLALTALITEHSRCTFKADPTLRGNPASASPRKPKVDNGNALYKVLRGGVA